MEAIKKYKQQLFFHLILNAAVGAMITFASFSHYPLDNFKDHIFYLMHFLALQFSVSGFLYFLSINRLLFKIVFPFLFVVFAIIAYWVYVQDIAISQGIIQVALETKPDIALDLISLPFVAYIFLAVIAIAILLKLQQSIGVNQWKSPLIVFAVAGMLSYFVSENYKYGVYSSRLPYVVIVSAKEYLRQNKLELKPISQPLKASADSVNVVFILGESVRADHMQLNGYNRKTNPLLSKRRNLISFANTYTPLTFTAVSIPQILTDAALTDDYSRPKYSLIDMLNKSQIQTHWIGNQTPERSYEVFIDQSKFSKIIDPLHSELSFQKEYDAKLLPIFKDVFKPFQNQFTTLHMMGSHWWYETRYPDAFRSYKPVIKSKHIPSNSSEEMINSYDNTILYLDYFINETIKEIEKQPSNTILIYLSDHGELLGENNLWLHAQNGKSVANPAMLVWYSDGFEKIYPEIVNNLKSNRTKKINLDFFFPSIVDLFGINGIKYDTNKSLWNAAYNAN